MKIAVHLLPGAVFLSLVASPAAATDEDTQLWLFLNATAPVANGVTATFELSPRAREGSDQLLGRVSLETRVAEGLTVSGGMTFVEFDGGHEYRPHQQIAYTTGPLSVRTRLEQRFFDGADRPQIRLRQQVRLAFPLDAETLISGMGELLYAVQRETRGADAQVDQWRAEVAVRRRLSAHFDATLAYRAILSPRGPQEDRLSHVPVITLAWRP